MSRSIVIGSLLLVVAACREPTGAAARPIAELLAVPEQLVVDGVAVELAVDLWRDFMPITEPDGRPLLVAAAVETAPAGLAMTRVWVVNGSEVWTASLELNGAGYWVARDGPKWGPGVNVDVVFRLVASSGVEYQMRLSAVPIVRTD